MQDSAVELLRLARLIVPGLLLAASCASVDPLEAGVWRTIDTATGESIELDTLADALAGREVVFLGEQHDSDVGHALQLELARRLAARRGSVALSMEMFEQDVQEVLDAYLAGAIPEGDLLASGRPWPNYAEHYRPAVEWAREHGARVIAANAPRRLARRISEEGLDALTGAAWLPAEVHVPEDAYKKRFEEAMRDHPEVTEEELDRFFAAQCAKDEAMAEAILAQLEREPDTLVVHWCGRFHSDHGLGTVERLLRRRPHTRVGVVSMAGPTEQAPAPTGDDLAAAPYLWWIER